jgi:hypothetical protein
MGKEDRNNAADGVGELLLLLVRVRVMRISTEPFMPKFLVPMPGQTLSLRGHSFLRMIDRQK